MLTQVVTGDQVCPVIAHVTRLIGISVHQQGSICDNQIKLIMDQKWLNISFLWVVETTSLTNHLTISLDSIPELVFSVRISCLKLLSCVPPFKLAHLVFCLSFCNIFPPVSPLYLCPGL